MKLYQKVANTLDTLNGLKTQLEVELMKANELLVSIEGDESILSSDVNQTIDALAYHLMLLIRYEKIERTLK